MAIVLGLIVGAVLGLTGAGGSVLAVPLLMVGLGWSLPQAVPVALLAVASAAAYGAYMAWRKSYVRYRAALLMGALGTATAPLGLNVARHTPASALALVFAAVMTVVALRMWRQARRAPEDARVLRASVAGEGEYARGPLCKLHAVTGRIRWTRPCALLLAAVGAATGFLSGLLGVGGGFVIVPALRAATELSMHSAVATSLMVIAITAGGGLGVALLRGESLPWAVALPFMLGGLAGMAGGRVLSPWIAGARLQQGFALLMLAAAAGLAGRTLLA